MKDIKNTEKTKIIEPPFYTGDCTYILRCADGTFYTGWTNDLEKRLHAHNRGTGSRYTRSRRPVELIWFLPAPSKEEAMHREARIKRLSRREKLLLLSGVPLDRLLSPPKKPRKKL